VSKRCRDERPSSQIASRRARSSAPISGSACPRSVTIGETGSGRPTLESLLDGIVRRVGRLVLPGGFLLFLLPLPRLSLPLFEAVVRSPSQGCLPFIDTRSRVELHDQGRRGKSPRKRSRPALPPRSAIRKVAHLRCGVRGPAAEWSLDKLYGSVGRWIGESARPPLRPVIAAYAACHRLGAYTPSANGLAMPEGDKMRTNV
jgi:hypothetical protein